MRAVANLLWYIPHARAERGKRGLLNLFRYASDCNQIAGIRKGSPYAIMRGGRHRGARTAVMRSKAIIWATLKRCGMSAKGCRVDPANGIVALLIKSGLLTVRKSGLVALTVKGREALKRAARSPKKRLVPKPRNEGSHEAATRGHRGSGESAVILPFRRRHSG